MDKRVKELKYSLITKLYEYQEKDNEVITIFNNLFDDTSIVFEKDNTLIKDNITFISFSLCDITFDTSKYQDININQCCIESIIKINNIIDIQKKRIEENVKKNDILYNQEPTYHKKIFVLGKEYLKDIKTDDEFVAQTYHYGKVFDNIRDILEYSSKDYVIKIIDIATTTIEYCPHCGYDVVIDAKFEYQKCPICGNSIVPCSLCIECKNNCKLNRK